MKSIKKITGIVNAVLGLAIIGIEVVGLSHVPEAFRNANQDPNEIFLLAVVMSILGLVGGAFLLSSVILLRNRGSFFFQVHKVTWLLIAGVAILIACAVVSFIPPPNGVNYPELRLLLIPAVVLAWSIYVMRSVPTTQPRDQRGE